MPTDRQNIDEVIKTYCASSLTHYKKNPKKKNPQTAKLAEAILGAAKDTYRKQNGLD